MIRLILAAAALFLTAAALYALFKLGGVLVREDRKRRDAIARRRAAIAARADQQHQWVMQGDDRGIYGSECASLMHYIEQGGTQAASTTENQVAM